MFGDKPIPECSLVEKTISDQVVLKLEDVEVMNSRDVIGLKKVSFEIREGEIFGIAGVDGNGQKSLCESIAGQRELVSGRIRFKGEDLSRKSVSNRHEMGISYITDDRMNEGCVLDLSLSENAILRRYRQAPYSRFSVINNSVVDGYANELIRDFDVKATGPDVRAGTLSGGNIQKFILARGLSTKPGLIVCSKPTYGLDARTVSYIQELLLEESKQGTSVLLVGDQHHSLAAIFQFGYGEKKLLRFNGCQDRCGFIQNQGLGTTEECFYDFSPLSRANGEILDQLMGIDVLPILL